MKNLVIFCMIVQCLSGCKKDDPIINSPGIPSGETFFRLIDKNKIDFLNKDQIVMNVLNDGSKTYPLLKNEVGFTPSNDGSVFFRLFSNVNVTERRFKSGDNQIELSYPDGTKDKLQLNLSITPSGDRYSAIIIYNKVIFNGTEVLKQISQEPVPTTYVFDLK